LYIIYILLNRITYYILNITCDKFSIIYYKFSIIYSILNTICYTIYIYIFIIEYYIYMMVYIYIYVVQCKQFINVRILREREREA
jgi:hypothetical protein